MRYRTLGRTGLQVSEVGFGGEWLERLDQEHVTALLSKAEEEGINILDIWMSNPDVRTHIGNALAGHREKWILQGHIGSTWQGGQYVRTRELPKVKEAFEDLLARLRTDYIDLGMIHYVDSESEWDSIVSGPFLAYVKELQAAGTVRHIGLSTHNPNVAKKAALSGIVEMILFSVNPAFDLQPPSEDVNICFAEQYDASLAGIDPQRAELYRVCEQENVGITVMKGYAAGRLFSAETSPFGVALTPVQCIHYALTRPAVASILPGYFEEKHIDDAIAYETASEAEKDYATVLAGAPKHAFGGKCMYCNHCLPCAVGIDIAMVGKLYDLALMQDKVPASLREHYRALDKNADDCIGCGSCEQRCPFHVHIVERMQAAQDLFR